MVSQTLPQLAVTAPLQRRLLGPVTASLVLGAAAVYTAAANPYQSGFFPSCIYLATTGHWCPGCGGLRATHELLRGDFGAAMGMNPVVVLVILPLIVFSMGWWMWSAAGVRTPRVRIPTWAAWALPALLGVFWVVRNIPALEPWLAP